MCLNLLLFPYHLIRSGIGDEMAETEKYRSLFGSTIKDFVLVDSESPCSIMQIDLCGGVFGLPEFAKAPPVQTMASILEQELESPSNKVEVIPILNEALERRMFHFTMSLGLIPQQATPDGAPQSFHLPSKVRTQDQNLVSGGILQAGSICWTWHSESRQG